MLNKRDRRGLIWVGFAMLALALGAGITASGTFAAAPSSLTASAPSSIAAPNVCPQTFTDSIVTGDPTQTGRVSRDAVVATCAAPKGARSAIDSTLRHYMVYSFTNTSRPTQCERVQRTNNEPCTSHDY